MFDPTKAKADKAEKAKKKKILADLQDWATSIVPMDIREGLLMDVKEVQCGDPECAPIDTIFTMVWTTSNGRGMIALPLSPEEVTQDDLIDNFPDDVTLAKWSRGEKAPWPPRPELRFEIGERVECRIGPHPVKGWAAGRVIKHFYTEPNWPPNMVAPYQIALHDGRLIFAPADNDNVIRKRAPAKEGDPPSPEFHPPPPDSFEYDDGDEYGDVDFHEVNHDFSLPFHISTASSRFCMCVCRPSIALSCPPLTILPAHRNIVTSPPAAF